MPSSWARDVFAASGVDPAKLVVVPEGVNTTWWVVLLRSTGMLSVARMPC